MDGDGQQVQQPTKSGGLLMKSPTVHMSGLEVSINFLPSRLMKPFIPQTELQTF